jgi:hypothetical protein
MALCFHRLPGFGNRVLAPAVTRTDDHLRDDTPLTLHATPSCQYFTLARFDANPPTHHPRQRILGEHLLVTCWTIQPAPITASGRFCDS